MCWAFGVWFFSKEAAVVVGVVESVGFSAAVGVVVTVLS